MIDEEGKKVLKALAELTEPAGGKEIAEVSGLDSKKVASKITALKKEGLVDSPVRCKYCITDAGKESLL